MDEEWEVIWKVIEINADYNWHYLRDLEIMATSDEVLIALKDGGFDIASLSGDNWYSSDYVWDFDEVVAWKYIEKPLL